MSKIDLEATYRDYIACLNKQDWPNLGRFVHGDVRHNGRPLGIDGYRAMLEADYEQIRDLRFEIQIHPFQGVDAESLRSTRAVDNCLRATAAAT